MSSGRYSNGVPRLVTHAFVLAVALTSAALAPLGLHQLPEIAATGSSGTVEAQAVRANSGLEAPQTASVASQPSPLRTYSVSAGDTVAALARQAHISVDTLAQVNHVGVVSPLQPGTTMIIPPVDGNMVSVAQGETLQDLGAAYRADVGTILSANGLSDGSRLPAQVFIPAADTEALAPPASAGLSESQHHLARFSWPAKGTITTYFWQYHPGIDIANVEGTPELAADAGRVVFAGWGSYGIYVEIDHGNGFHTVYGHMSRLLVSIGDVVTPGQEIGLMGSTGRSTGPHLHFEIRYQGVPQNPLDFLQ
ncbi:MAG: M23 family metallopeptidase [Candidatus Dormibacteria bacterium]